MKDSRIEAGLLVKFILVTFFMFFSTISWAYRTGSFSDTEIDPQRDIVHVFVIGYSHGMGNQFTKAAVTRALKYKELYPTHKSIFIKNSEDNTWSTRLETLVDSDLLLYGGRLLEIIDEYKKIASIDIYSHSSPLTGVGLEPNLPKARLRVRPSWVPNAYQTPNIERLADGNFIPGAYATINGCNSGFLLAPKLSELWKIPVQAALTSTDFQQLHENGTYYFNNEGDYPSSGGWRSENDLFFASPRSCSGGGCMRMKPVNAPYTGSWGTLKGGLPFYKTFCNYNISSDECSKIMSKILQVYPSQKNLNANSSIEDYKTVLIDFLCPISIRTNVREICENALRNSLVNGNEVYGSLGVQSLECDLKGCQGKVECEYDNDGNAISGTCTLANPQNSSPKTTIKEFKLYLRGFELSR